MPNAIRPSRAAAIVAAAAVSAALLAGCSNSATAEHPAAHSSQVVKTAPTAAPVRATAVPPVAPKAVARPKPKPNPCAANTHRQLVRVSLSAQHLWMCERTHLVRDTPVTSGMTGKATATPTGHYRIQGLNRNSVLTLDTGKQYDVKYWIPFNAPLFGFHDSSWQQFPYGSAQYRTDGSHGCVHMPLKAIAFLYRWADIGASVTIA